MPISLRGPSTSRPSIKIFPLVLGSRPARILSKVDLPQPLWPTIETNSPRSTAKETSRSASTSVPSRDRYTLESRSTRIDSGTPARIISYSEERRRSANQGASLEERRHKRCSRFNVPRSTLQRVLDLQH